MDAGAYRELARRLADEGLDDPLLDGSPGSDNDDDDTNSGSSEPTDPTERRAWARMRAVCEPSHTLDLGATSQPTKCSVDPLTGIVAVNHMGADAVVFFDPDWEAKGLAVQPREVVNHQLQHGIMQGTKVSTHHLRNIYAGHPGVRLVISVDDARATCWLRHADLARADAGLPVQVALVEHDNRRIAIHEIAPDFASSRPVRSFKPSWDDHTITHVQGMTCSTQERAGEPDRLLLTIADGSNNRVLICTADEGNVLACFKVPQWPWAIAVDDFSQRLVAAANDATIVFDLSQWPDASVDLATTSANAFFPSWKIADSGGMHGGDVALDSGLNVLYTPDRVANSPVTVLPRAGASALEFRECATEPPIELQFAGLNQGIWVDEVRGRIFVICSPIRTGENRSQLLSFSIGSGVSAKSARKR